MAVMVAEANNLGAVTRALKINSSRCDRASHGDDAAA
jgi:hypothetical protein